MFFLFLLQRYNIFFNSPNFFALFQRISDNRGPPRSNEEKAEKVCKGGPLVGDLHIQLSDILGGHFLDIPAERRIVSGVIHDIPVVVPITGEDFIRFNAIVLAHIVEVFMVHEKLADSGVVTDDDALAAQTDLDGDVGNAFSVDGLVEVGDIQDILILPDDRLVFDSGFFQCGSEKVGGLAATSAEQAVIVHIPVNDSSQFTDEGGAVDGVHGVMVFSLFLFLLRRYN